MLGKVINSNNQLPKENLKFAVIGHTEWITFLEVEQMPSPGLITHAKQNLELPAGGGAVIARTLAELNNEVHFFTSLGKDFYGKKSFELLEEIGLKLHRFILYSCSISSIHCFFDSFSFFVINMLLFS